MLELIYNPFYDQPVYAGEEKPENSFLRKKYVGKLGLLDELELRLGLKHPKISETERLVSYFRAVKEADSVDNSLFFHNSFTNDPLGVASSLLKWRDALVYAGWKNSDLFSSSVTELSSVPISTGAKEKFIGLTAVEEIFSDTDDFSSNKGTSDYWMDILDAVQEDDNDLSKMAITINVNEDLLRKSDPMLHHIFSLLSGRCNAAVQYTTVEENKETQQIHLITLPDQVEAYQWLFAGEHGTEFKELDEALADNNVLLINEDNVSLNGVFDCLGKPCVESQFTNVNTPLLQLFRNGLTQFRKPVDIKGLQDYLSSPIHPLNDFVIKLKNDKKDDASDNKKSDKDEISLRWILLDYLKKQKGFGKNDHAYERKDENGDILISFKGLDFKGIIDKFVDSGSDIQRDKILSYLGPCNSEQTLSDMKVRTKDVLSYCSVMIQWLNKPIKCLPLLRDQIKTVKSYFTALSNVLQILDKGEISYDELMKYASSISSLQQYKATCESKGACQLVREPSALNGHISKPVVWLDCYDKGITDYEYDFFTQEDCERLSDTSNMSIPQKASICEQSIKSISRAFSCVDNLYLIFPNRVNGHLCQKHSLFIQYEKDSTCIQNDFSGWTFDSELSGSVCEFDVLSANDQKDEYEIGKGIITEEMFDKRGDDDVYMSASSLEKLFNTPFDYTMNYLFSLNEEENSRLNTLKGSVAHLFINEAFKSCSEKSGEMTFDQLESYCQKDFNSKLERAAIEEGALLLSPENLSEYHRFETIFKTISLPHLVQLMKEFDLKMVASELNIKDKAVLKNDKVYCKLSGSIDCVMKSKDGEPIILDFKWTENAESRKSRVDEVKTNRALQLCVYRTALNQIIQKETLPGLTGNSQVLGSGYYLLYDGVLITDCQYFLGGNPELMELPAVHDQQQYEELNDQLCTMFDYRRKQLIGGTIEEGEKDKDAKEKDSLVQYINDFNPKKLYPIKGFDTETLSLKKEAKYNDYRTLKGRLK